jgi:hypothetical protein
MRRPGTTYALACPRPTAHPNGVSSGTGAPISQMQIRSARREEGVGIDCYLEYMYVDVVPLPLRTSTVTVAP